MRDDERQGRSAPRAKADGQPVTTRAWSTMSKSKNNGVDPQELIDQLRRRHRAPVRDVRRPPEQTLEWNDAGVEGAHRFLRRRVELRREARATRCGRRAPAQRREPRPRKALRREMHLLLRQVSYDYERMQYNTVVSGAMKMLNALEAFKADGCDGDAACCAKASACCCARCTRPARTSPMCCGASWASRASSATCSTRPGRRSTRPRWCRTRSNWCCRSTASCAARCAWPAAADTAAIEAAALASPEFAQVRRRQAAPKKVDRRAGPAGQRGRLSCAPRRRAAAAARRRCWPLAGCGFELRRAADAAVRQHRADRLRAALAAGRGAARDSWQRSVAVVESPAQAQVVLAGAERRARDERGGLHRRRPGA